MAWKNNRTIPTIEELWNGEIWVKDNLIKRYGWPLSKEVVESRMNLAIASSELDNDVVDYYAAVALAPGDKLAEDIRSYRRKWFITDEVAFMRELQKKYSCSEECIKQRFKEVHQLIRAHKISL